MKVGVAGPRSVIPRNPAVLVATPSIDRFPAPVSSIEMLGESYPGMTASLTDMPSRGRRNQSFGFLAAAEEWTLYPQYDRVNSKKVA
jgi:hypothetical protein